MAQLTRRKNHPPIALVACASILLIAVFLGAMGLPVPSRGIELLTSHEEQETEVAQEQEPEYDLNLASDFNPTTDSNSDPNHASVPELQESTSEALRDDLSPTELVVHVDGAVAQPGVYSLLDGARVSDAVAAAGGLDNTADVTSINLAAKVSDGVKIYIPAQGERVPQLFELAGNTDTASADSTRETSSARININTADVAELIQLNGVGEATANAIVEDRERYGPFSCIEDIMRVSGIGEKKFERIKDKISV